MAAGLSAAIQRFEVVIDAALPGWERTHQRITSLLEEEEVVQAGIDKRYHIRASSRGDAGPLTGDLADRDYIVFVEFARCFRAGDIHGYDAFTLQQSLESDVNSAEQFLLYKNNWDYSNTGIILINLESSELVEQNLEAGTMVWVSEFAIRVRQSNVAQTA